MHHEYVYVYGMNTLHREYVYGMKSFAVIAAQQLKSYVSASVDVYQECIINYSFKNNFFTPYFVMQITKLKVKEMFQNKERKTRRLLYAFGGQKGRC